MGIIKTRRLAAMQKQQRANDFFRCLFHACMSDRKDCDCNI